MRRGGRGRKRTIGEGSSDRRSGDWGGGHEAAEMEIRFSSQRDGRWRMDGAVGW